MRFFNLLLRVWVALLTVGSLGACNKTEEVKDSPLEVPIPPPTSHATISVLVAYTADAWDALDAGGEDVRGHAAYRIELTNTVLSNSGVSHEVELADAVRLDDVEADIYTHYDCEDTEDMAVCGKRWLVDSLQDDTSGPATERINSRADIVMLVMTPDQDGLAGGATGAIPEATAPYAQAGASIESDLTLPFAHELGHLFGAGHDRYARGEENVGGIDYGESYPVIASRSLMAYANECDDLGVGPCPQVAWLTNPSVILYGEHLGDEETEFNACRVEHFGPHVSTYYEVMYESAVLWPMAFITDCPYDSLSDVHSVVVP